MHVFVVFPIVAQFGFDWGTFSRDKEEDVDVG